MSQFWSEMASRAEPYVPGEQSEVADIIKLNTNENPYPPSPRVSKAIAEEIERKLQLYPSPTVDTIKEKVARQYQLQKENVFVGNGSDEVLGFAFMAFFDQDKTIRFPEITYSFYPVYAKLFGIPYETISLKRDFTIVPEDYFQSEGGVIFPNPNAPTGIYLELGHVIDIVESNPDQVVIVDEAYIDFAGESAASLVNTYENLLVVQTMSKSRSLAGLRVGYALGSEDLIKGLNRIKNSFNSYTLDRLAIAGAEAALDDQKYFDMRVQQVIETREWVTSRMKQLGFMVLPSKTNFILVSHYKFPAKALYERLKACNVLVRYFDKPKITNYLRITIGTDADMRTCLERIDKVMTELAADVVHS
ncbi:histidinol-phosphate transaminase [Lentibacillus sp. L22]|uniref:histidinol-phosphate transaminase n=1 Tax=Lentibacillus TaxID=175304 RepID=UPI0022B1134D|nr:histidinol-phosphate transaminase [Lentibacillus daqui]